ncbi:thrombospondin type 3 repeat-containing protein [Haloferula sp. BvORR071]|uniref:thrombospondin type 3 repeat-containing protein n=1 Tax=Haloferula sp. BvORR071 TaxID=1396141 RepID=UPI000550326A|nr:thrombospondin type 3 repeat-containing protein [Haloferula sp. BvORR071]
MAGLLLPVAQADLVVQAAQGNVLLAFRDTTASGTGSYLVNIGPVAQFAGAAAGSSTAVATIGALGADLDEFDSTEGGEDVIPWHQRSKVVWSAFSRNASDQDAIYISRPRTSIAQQSTPYAARNGFAHNTAFAEISSVIGQGYNVLSSTVGAPNSAGNARGGFQTSTASDSPVYRFQVATEARQDFATWPNIEKDFGAGAANSALDFYVHRKAPALSSLGTVDYLGYFSITSAGVVSFTRAASNPNLDSDGDGFTDADEVIAGTDPNNASSYFKIAPPVVVPGTSRTFNLTTIASRRYAIEYNADLATGAWAEVYVHSSGTGAAPLNWVDTDPARNAAPRGFYRAKVTNP